MWPAARAWCSYFWAGQYSSRTIFLLQIKMKPGVKQKKKLHAETGMKAANIA